MEEAYPMEKEVEVLMSPCRGNCRRGVDRCARLQVKFDRCEGQVLAATNHDAWHGIVSSDYQTQGRIIWERPHSFKIPKRISVGQYVVGCQSVQIKRRAVEK